MMGLIGLLLFTSALSAVIGVLALTLWPSLPRMAALLAGDGAVLTPVPARRVVARRVSIGRVVPAASAWRVAA